MDKVEVPKISNTHGPTTKLCLGLIGKDLSSSLDTCAACIFLRLCRGAAVCLDEADARMLRALQALFFGCREAISKRDSQKNQNRTSCGRRWESY